MFGMKSKVIDEHHKVAAAARRATYRNLFHAAASIRKTAIESIERSPDPSEEGEPPHTRGFRRGGLREAIAFEVELRDEQAVVGVDADKLGRAGEPHEHGRKYKGQEYEERPFMGPALEKNRDRFARGWAGSIG